MKPRGTGECSRCERPHLPNHRYCEEHKRESDRAYRKRRREERERFRRRYPAELRAEYLRHGH